MGTSRLKRAAIKMAVACGSFSRKQILVDPVSLDSFSVSAAQANLPSEAAEEQESGNSVSSKSLCAICLDPLSYKTGSNPGKAIFTAQCSHSFHFTCISSNVCHGSVTCPICRTRWTQLPRNFKPAASLNSWNRRRDPILQILDDSIATFRVHRRSSFLGYGRHDDDDLIQPEVSSNRSRLLFSLKHTSQDRPGCYPQCFQAQSYSSIHSCRHQLESSSPLLVMPPDQGSVRAFLSVKLAPQKPTDLVLVACPNGPHLEFLKQSMALVVFSLRSVDRLSIVTDSSSSSSIHIFPLRRMSPSGKRTALQVIDRLSYAGQPNLVEGLEKGIKILEDRIHENPKSCILHLSDIPSCSYRAVEMEAIPIPIYRFQVGCDFGASDAFVMLRFEEWIGRMLGSVVRETQLRIAEEGRTVRLGELRGGEERRIVLCSGDCTEISVGYSYVEGEFEECATTGQTVVRMEEKVETRREGLRGMSAGGRPSSVENYWECHDPPMARRWAKHLHGYRL